MDPNHVALLEQFVKVLKQKPNLIHDPKLTFFKDYLISLGATLPEDQSATSTSPGPSGESKATAGQTNEEEEDVPKPEYDYSYVIEEADYDEVELPSQVEEVSEESMEKSSELRSAAMAALGDYNLEEALKLFTEALKSNPNSAPIFAKRASVLCKLKRPSAALKDCDRALKVNPDSALALMWRGRARMILGDFEAAQKDFSQSARIDTNETLEEWIKENKPNADKMNKYKIALDRAKKDREVRAKKERLRRAQEEREKAERENAAGASGGTGMPGGAGFPPGAGAGSHPGAGMGMPGNIQDLFSDPEIMSAMQDPEVMNAFMDVQRDPNNISKYEHNEKVQKVLQKLAEKFGGPDGANM